MGARAYGKRGREATAKTTNGFGAGVSLAVAGGPLNRLKGLLFNLRLGQVLLITPCSSIHTIGMRVPIQVAFFDAEGRVLRVEDWVVPGRLLRCPGAEGVLERAIPEDEDLGAWFEVGDQLELTLW
jgi:uncharacterized membrane protein (UPF0127 family)